ncbi:hypothetical protein Dsin_005208 [Dipteronia sinensis]|uniref:Zinc knuckle CX2CX4HX4C domain-containing protein n=1 Tax=Dipteronia sinensis TaxID=43782 RepID=A0AAE0AW31_9ROSI|nr:hypothetical protein Dsin_005208 [Dipteronia sinensis]
MGSENIDRLCASMSLKKREGPIRKLQDDLLVAEERKLAICLADDRQKVLAGGPRSFDDTMIVLEEPTGKRAITGLKFNMAEFWVQISNLPILCITKEIGLFLESIIGDVREVDIGPSGDFCGKFLRVRVIIKIDKPLKRFLRVNVLGDGKETVMLIQYERLPNFCFKLGLLGHTVHGCSETGDGGLPTDQDL